MDEINDCISFGESSSPLRNQGEIQTKMGKTLIIDGTVSLPCLAPAALVIDSFIKEPPKSLQPTASNDCAPPGPIFTHDAFELLQIHN